MPTTTPTPTATELAERIVTHAEAMDYDLLASFLDTMDGTEGTLLRQVVATALELCPVHECDDAICADDEDTTCAAARAGALAMDPYTHTVLHQLTLTRKPIPASTIGMRTAILEHRCRDEATELVRLGLAELHVAGGVQRQYIATDFGRGVVAAKAGK